MTKPLIPEGIALNFQLMEEQKTRLLYAVERQKVVQQEAETEHRKALIEAEKDAAVKAVQNKAMIEEKESLRLMAAIEGSCIPSRKSQSLLIHLPLQIKHILLARKPS